MKGLNSKGLQMIKVKSSKQKTMPVSYLDLLRGKTIFSRLLLIGLVFGLLLHATKQIEIVNIVPDSTTIQSLTFYTFSFERNDSSPNVPNGAYMQISFPQEYANRITYLSSPNVSCSSEDLNSPGMYCSFSGYVLRVWNGFGGVGGVKRFMLKVSNIMNPFPAREYGPFSVKIYLSDGNIFQQQTVSPPPVTTTPGQSTCSISSSTNNLVSARGSILISYQSTYISTTNSSYKMHISMNTSYRDDPLSTMINPQIAGYSTLGNIGKYTFQVNYTTSINVTMLFPPSTRDVDGFIFVQSFIDGVGAVDSCFVTIDNVAPNGIVTDVGSTNLEVQKQAMYSFTLTPSSPIFPTDSLIIEFPSTFDLSKVTSANFFLGIFGNKSLSKSNNIITIPQLVYAYIQSKTIKFNISAIVNPFDSRPLQLKLRTITTDGFIRDSSTFSLKINAGNFITNSFTCNTYQIGYKTACKINFTLTNSIKPDSQIRLIFPQGGWMLSQSGSNTQCQTQSTSSQLKSLFQCRYYDNKTFVLSKFTDWTNLTSIGAFSVVVSIEKSSIEIDHRVQLPWTVGNFVFTVGSYTNDNLAIDQGSYTFSTVKRQIFESDGNGVSFEKSETMTAGSVYAGYNLPYDNGVSYNMRLYLPLEMTIDQSAILSSYGSVISYESLSFLLNLKLTDTTAKTRNVTITGFKTYSSTKPIIYTVEFLYLGVVYFHFSSTVAIPNPKPVSTILVSISSPIVYAVNTVTLTLSELSAGDIIKYATSEYSNYLLSSNSSLCISAVVTCNLDGSLTVGTVNNADAALKLTRFMFPVRNTPFVGKPLFQLIVYDSTKNYLKQKSTFSLDVSQTNLIPQSSISYTSSNPYFREQTTLTIYFSLQVPGASKITISLPSTYGYFSSKCIKNCGSSSFDTGNNSFYAMASGNDIIVEFLVANPNDFSEFIGITSKDSFERNMDFGKVQLQAICTSPCRSCSVNNTVLCMSCYNFSTNKTLSNGKCLTQCPDGEYQVTQSSLFYCRMCPSQCLTCTSLTLCQKCKPSFIYFNSTCLSTCPGTYYAAIDQPSNTTECKKCFSACLQCSTSPTYCSRCVPGFFLYQNSCRTGCPTDWYSVNGQCVQCTTNCVVCQNQTAACLQCQNNFYLFQGNCFVNCPTAGFAKNISSGKCDACPNTCNVCGQFVTHCQQCRAGLFLLNGTCITNCSINEGYYSNSATQTCETCQDPCKRCSTLATYCLSCVAGKFLYNNLCYDRCPDGTYPTLSDSNLQCIACQWPCVKCSDSQTCSSCSSPYALNGSACVSSCGLSNFVNSQNQCEACPQKCKTCNITGCIQCSNSSEYLSGQNCVSSCAPLYKNDQSMVCQSCRNPCESCTTNSSACGSCIGEYSLMALENACYKVCPPKYFSENSYCKMCTQRNPSCEQCALSNTSFTCSSCLDNNFFLGFVCAAQCPEYYNATNGVCMTNNCSQLADCQLCSDVKCISCRALYTLKDNVCEFKVVSAISNLPVPFPFLILTVCTIVSAFILKIYFNQMYIPLYLYAFCGVFEAACIALWTMLAIMTSNANLQESVVNIYFATLLIVIVYVGFNILSFSLSCAMLKNDRKFMGWQRQDNKLGSTVISVISLVISFRFYLIKFSKLGNKQTFSATLQTKQKFSFLTTLSISSIFLISIPTVVLSAYLTYTQQQMNYLFFTCLQMGVVSVIMIVLAIMAVLTPSDYLLHKKDDYRKGYDSEQMEGKSMNELLCEVVEEQHYEGQSVGSVGKSDIQGHHFNQFTSQINFIEKITNAQIITDAKGLLDQKNSDQNDFTSVASNELIKGIEKHLELDDKQKISEMLQNTLKAKQRILDQMIDQENYEIIQQVNEEFGNSQSLPSKPFGTIVRQLVKQFEEYGSDQDESDIGQSLEDQQDEQSNDEEMTSSTMLKGKEYKHRKNQLKSHQNLSIEQQIKFMRDVQKRHNVEQNMKTVQKIKILAQQLALKQKQQQLLRQKLQNLNKNLQSSEYIKLRQKIQQNNMATQDKLSRLNEMYTRKKQQREKRKSRKISNADTYVLDKEEIQQNLQKKQFKYEPKQGKVEQIDPKQIKINSRLKQSKKEGKRIPQKIEVETKNKREYLRKKQKSQGKPEQKSQRQTKRSAKQERKKSPETQQKQRITQRLHNKQVVQQNQDLIRQQQNANFKQFQVGQEYAGQKKAQNLVQVAKKSMNKVRSAAVTRNNKKEHNLEPITQEDGKSRDGGYSVYLPIESSSKPRVSQRGPETSSNKNTKNSDVYMYEPEEEHKSNASWHQQPIERTKISPLAFAEPLPQDQPDSIYPIEQQHVVFGEDQANNNMPKIQYSEGNIESLEEEYHHWPIDPELEQRILDAEQKANSYLKASQQKKRRTLINYSSQNIPSNNTHVHSNPTFDDKIFQHSGGRSKYTQLNEPKETLSKDNSIFYGARESQADYSYLNKGQLLVFENDQELGDQLTSGEKLVSDNALEEDSKIHLEIDAKSKIPKRRVNRSVINLSPGKY